MYEIKFQKRKMNSVNIYQSTKTENFVIVLDFIALLLLI